MDIEMLRSFLGWCALINMALLLWWWGWFVFARELIYRMHSRWFKLDEQHFDTVHYAGMAVFKLGIILLNVAPWLALAIMR